QTDFVLPADIPIFIEKGKYNVFSNTKDFLFSIQFCKYSNLNDAKLFLIFLMYLLGFMFFISFLYFLYKSFEPARRNKAIFIIGFSLDIIIIRLVLFYFKIPHILYNSNLFSPNYYATSGFLPSLGDFLVNSLLILVIAYVVFKNLKLNFNWLKQKFFIRYVFVFLLFSLIFIFFKSLTSLFISLIIDSNISLKLNDIFSLSSYSVIGLFIIATMSLAFFLITSKLCELLFYLATTFKNYFSILIISSFVFYILCEFLYECEIFHIIFLFVFILSFWFFKKRQKTFVSFSSSVFYLVIFSLLSTFILYKYNDIKEKEKRKLLVLNLSNERDPIAEYLFCEIEAKVFSDEILINSLKNYSLENEIEEEKISNYIQKNYFNNYWEKYNFLITICNDTKILNVQPENYLINCNDYFNEIISKYGDKTFSENLYCLDYDITNDNYIAIINFDNYSEDSLMPITIYIEIFSKYVPKGLGYPELLIDKKISTSPDLSNYSYARYDNGKLVHHFGKYFYSINLANYGKIINNLSFFNRNKYNHLYYKVNSTTTFILSKKNPGFLDIVAPFSYLLIFFGVITLIFLFIIKPPTNLRTFELSFKKRLQYSMVSIILVSFIFIGITSLFYIINLNDNKNHDNLSEKAHSVLIELEHKLADEETLTSDMHNYLSGLLNKFSLVFFSDINLYDLNGNLLATSRPEIFDEGLISTKMNTIAFNNMSNNKKSLLIHNEKIGNYNYLSAYVPFRNEDNKLIAYLNLPYFAKQNDLTSEISTFLVAFINIYVLLIAIAIFVALIISNYITRPVQLIKDKIRQLKLGKPNEKIAWEKKDEIGNLVMEYNRMVEELAYSAELLAKSERETAWREMAKQVAHEIKNPLTPMKLSVQYLQKTWDEKTPDWDKRLKQFTHTIIEQIDSLSTIASEFSDFAQMPKTKNKKIELVKIIKNAIGLYKDSSSISINFNPPDKEKFYILADKEQILRIFNNLIKNSIQAIKKPDEGIIDISINTEGNSYIIKISDNGQGIPKSRHDKVFSPNFTTKSSGMGLGLAMSKNIVLNAGGDIRFESKEDIGTTFIISFPVIYQ
ncbi:MAG: GHKL domain-containing protein, partial [Bacteroidales bacterium]|nr:GHKL domain-containing protein [Bacteroidales bacterium]